MAYTISELTKKAQNVEELIVLAKENGIELSLEEAQEQFAKFNTDHASLSEDQLVHVAGGRTVY